MDKPIKDAIKQLEERLKEMKAGDKSVVFTCPRCGEK